MEAYQARVVKEKEELDSKLEKLSDFIDSSQLVALPPEEQERMHRQLKIMADYSQILGERIDAFSHD